MIDLDSLRIPEIPYLGWHLEGAAGPPASGTYVCYAREDGGPGTFKVTTDARQVVSRREDRYAEGQRAGLAITKGKVFLGTWQQEKDHRIVLPHERKVPTIQIRRLILGGLYRLYEQGFEEGDFQIDIEGIALDIGVKTILVTRALDFLYAEKLIDDYGTLGRNRTTGDVWLTPKGVQYVEAQRLPVETFLQELYSITLGRLSSLDPGLATGFDRLRELAESPGSSRQDLVGFAARVRDFIQELTDRMYQETGSTEAMTRERTIDKVKVIAAAAASKTSRKHVRALAEVVETHWRSLNEVQQEAVHAGTVETQRLFTYTLLFVADLLDLEPLAA
jgi:hypothetical protein